MFLFPLRFARRSLRAANPLGWKSASAALVIIRMPFLAPIHSGFTQCFNFFLTVNSATQVCFGRYYVQILSLWIVPRHGPPEPRRAPPGPAICDSYGRVWVNIGVSGLMLTTNKIVDPPFSGWNCDCGTFNIRCCPHSEIIRTPPPRAVAPHFYSPELRHTQPLPPREVRPPPPKYVGLPFRPPRAGLRGWWPPICPRRVGRMLHRHSARSGSCPPSSELPISLQPTARRGYV